jgi:heme a synthase
MPWQTRKAFAKFSKLVLAYTVVVIMWGAYVRATGSGAGCGDHWPLCNGELIPRNPGIERIIEFSHRLSSGLSLMLVVGLVMAARRIFSVGHPARRAAVWSLVFILGEALVGGMLVVLKLVAGNDSVLRAIVIALHLLNSFLLLFWLTKVAFLAPEDRTPTSNAARAISMARLCVLTCMAAIVATGAAGAIAALGDSLFPIASLAEGLAQDASPTAHFLIRLRVWHPIFACFSMIYIVVQSLLLPRLFKGVVVRKIAWMIGGLVFVQVLGGFVNMILLAPVWMQLFHLMMADLIWILLCIWYFSVGQRSLEVNA